MEGNKYLFLARQARAEANSEDAKLYYGKLREDEPENAEAKFFYAYYSMYEGKNGELPTRYTNLCKSALSSVRMVNISSAPESEQLATIHEIVSAFVPEAWSLNRYMNAKNRETKVGDSYVKVFETSAISLCIKEGLNATRNLGDEIVKLYPDNDEAAKIAVIAWKEYVSLAQNWYAYAPKGDAEVYAGKIKEYDPAYEIPKKAGCISFGDAKK